MDNLNRRQRHFLQEMENVGVPFFKLIVDASTRYF